MIGAFVVSGADADTLSVAIDALFVVAGVLAGISSLPSKVVGAFFVVVSDADTPYDSVDAPSIVVFSAVAGAFIVAVKYGRFIRHHCC